MRDPVGLVLGTLFNSSWKLARALATGILIAGIVPASAMAQEATVSAPINPVAGAKVQINWLGPDGPGDFIAIADPDMAASSFHSYARTSGGSPASLIVPGEGAYEVRYISANGLSVLAKTGFEVGLRTPVGAIFAPPEIEAGQEISVSVTDPGEPANYVTIVLPAAPNTALGPYARMKGATTVLLVAPDVAGAYEIRLIRANDQKILASTALEVLPSAATPSSPSAEATVEPQVVVPQAIGQPVTLMALLAVDAGRPFHVAWSGPSAAGDRIELLDVGSVAALDGQTITDSSPFELTAPEAPGTYELVFISGGDVLARRGIEVR